MPHCWILDIDYIDEYYYIFWIIYTIFLSVLCNKQLLGILEESKNIAEVEFLVLHLSKDYILPITYNGW